jgi:Flp pilus assembly protein CpaB
MAESSSANELRYLPATGDTRRTLPNISSGVMVMLLSGLVAFVAFLYATQSNSGTTEVLTLRADTPPGQAISAADFVPVPVHAEPAQLDRLIAAGDKAKYDGWVATSPLHGGDLVTKSALAAPGTTGGLRTMSIPVEKAHAVAGSLHTGDRVDVIDASKALYAVQDVMVTTVDEGSGSLGSSDYSVTLAVSADQAIRLADAARNGKIDLVRSTGVTAGASR